MANARTPIRGPVRGTPIREGVVRSPISPIAQDIWDDRKIWDDDFIWDDDNGPQEPPP